MSKSTPSWLYQPEGLEIREKRFSHAPRAIVNPFGIPVRLVTEGTGEEDLRHLITGVSISMLGYVHVSSQVPKTKGAFMHLTSVTISYRHRGAIRPPKVITRRVAHLQNNVSGLPLGVENVIKREVRKMYPSPSESSPVKLAIVYDPAAHPVDGSGISRGITYRAGQTTSYELLLYVVDYGDNHVETDEPTELVKATQSYRLRYESGQALRKPD